MTSEEANLTAKIHQTLLLLSTRDGATSERLRAHGGLLRDLPVVVDAHTHQKLSASEWPLAARSAMECLISSQGNFPGLHGKFVRRILALDGHPGSLQARIADFLVEEQGYGASSPTTQMRRRDSLLSTLAESLRLARKYPCADPPNGNDHSTLQLLISALEQQAQMTADILRGFQTVPNSQGILEEVLDAWGYTPSANQTFRENFDRLLEEQVQPTYQRVYRLVKHLPADRRPLSPWPSVHIRLADQNPIVVIKRGSIHLVATLLASVKDDEMQLDRWIQRYVENPRRSDTQQMIREDPTHKSAASSGVEFTDLSDRSLREKQVGIEIQLPHDDDGGGSDRP